MDKEEQIEYYKEELNEILNLGQSINIAKQTLEEAYNEIKNEITPKFTKDLSSVMEKISNGKYSKENFKTGRRI